jgi:hypothetical protein
MTARQLRCVGGPHDGEYHVVKPGRSYVPLVKATRNMASFFPFNPTMDDVLPVSASAVQTDYVVRTLRFSGHPDDCFSFLSPCEMNILEAIELQFSKPHPPKCSICTDPPPTEGYFYVCSKCRGKP